VDHLNNTATDALFNLAVQPSVTPR